MTPKEFGAYLRELRIKAGYESQSALAAACKVESSTIHRLESGSTKHPKPQTLKIIAPFLQVSYEELLRAAGIIESGEIVYTPPEEESFDAIIKEFKAMKKDEQYEVIKKLFDLIAEDNPKKKGKK